MSGSMPPLPPGFSLDAVGDHPPLPPGFTLDAPVAAPAAQQGPAVPVKTVSSDAPVAHRGYAAQVRANMVAPEESGRTLKPWAEVGQNYADMGGGAITGAALGAPSAIIGAPGDVEAVGRWVGNKINPKISRETFMPTSSGVMNAVAGEPATPEAAYGRFLGSMASPYAYEKGADLAAKGVGAAAKNVLGFRSGAGAASVNEAYQAGKEGGAAADAFTSQMRPGGDPSVVVDTAKKAVNKLGAERSAAYRAGIGSSIKGDATVLDMQPIIDAVGKASSVGTFKGQTISESADLVRQKIADVVNKWAGLDPAEYHTPEGLDALKQKIGDLAYDGTLQAAAKPGSPGAKIIDDVYNAVKDQVVAQAPKYAEVMKDYQDATEELRNIKSTLSLNPKATVDTSLRKLQSILRNNANTNYGARAAMGARLQDVGDGTLMPGIAGQMMSSWTPRGLQGPEAGVEATAAILTGHPGLLPVLAASSPRLVGEGAFAAGKAAGRAKEIAAALSNATNINSTTAPLALNAPQLLARLLSQQQPARVSQ